MRGVPGRTPSFSVSTAWTRSEDNFRSAPAGTHSPPYTHLLHQPSSKGGGGGGGVSPVKLRDGLGGSVRAH